MIGWIILAVIVVVLCVTFLIFRSLTAGKTPEISKVYPDINIPDGEFLHYGNYFKGGKYADMYVVTEKVRERDRVLYYRSYIDVINASDKRNPSRNYKEWPSLCIFDPVHGSIIESVANLAANALDNWVEYKGIVSWHIKRIEQKYQFSIKTEKTGVVKERKGRIKANSTHPSYDMWGTFFIASRFCDLDKKTIMDTINPVYYPTASPYFYDYTGLDEKYQAGSTAYRVKKYKVGYVLSGIGSFLFGMKFMIKYPDMVKQMEKEPFEIYVEDSDRRLTVKMHTIAGGGDYILEEVSDVKSHKLFRT